MIRFAMVDEDLQPKQMSRRMSWLTSSAAVLSATACTVSLFCLRFTTFDPSPELVLHNDRVLIVAFVLFSASVAVAFTSPLTRYMFLGLRILSSLLIPAGIVIGEIFFVLFFGPIIHHL